MINKLIKKIIKFLKQEYKSIIFIAFFAFIILFPLPYYIMIGGGTIQIDEKISIDNSYSDSGDFYFAYVKEIKATPITYLLGKIIPSFTILKNSDVKYDNESDSDYQNRDKVYLNNSSSTATYVAYKSAMKEINVISTDNYVMYIKEYAKTNLKVGDIIISCDGILIDKTSTYKSIVESKDIGSKLNLKIYRNNKEMDAYIHVIYEDNIKLTGIAIMENINFETKPEINIKFKDSESGSSGGLMLALTIYNKLVKEDITKGLKIVGTGTIDYDGNVGEIGGVKYKLMGAIKANADVFIVPEGENYLEALKIITDNAYNIKLIKAINFYQVLEDLKSI